MSELASPAGEQQGISDWIVTRRKASGKTQTELALEIGVGLRSIQRWEAGENLEHIASTMRLLSALGVRIEGGDLPTSVSAELLALRRELTAALAATSHAVQDALAALH